MAISDTLFEASHEIQRYLRDYPDSYSEWTERLARLISEMDDLRRELDTPPTMEEIEAYRRRKQQ